MSHADDHQGTRRDFIYYATAGAGAVVTGAAVWPLINQMNPSADVQALASIRVDVADVGPGTQLTVLWQGKPVFVRRRTEEQIAQAVADDQEVERNIDPMARNFNISSDALAIDENRHPEGKPEWLVLVGLCTHLGCVPLGAGEGEDKGEFDGYFCPCHGSHYDAAGRIRKGPAPTNLAVPEFEFTSESTIRVG